MLIYLDLETTGLERSDRICSVGLIIEDGEKREVCSERVRPPCKVSTEAMAVHHITNEMLKEAVPFSDSKSAERLRQLNSTENILVGHNVGFDLEMLAKEGLLWQGGFIDTLRCSRHLIEEIDRFSLQYLRYELGLYRAEEAPAASLKIDLVAHDALSDAFHVSFLHGYLNTMADDSVLMQLSSEAVLIKKFVFGKYKGHYIEEVAMQDAGYLRWLLGQELDEDLEHTIKQYI